MASVRGLTRALTIRWASAVQRSFNGSSIQSHSARCRGRTVELRMWTIGLQRARWKILAPSSLGGTCSARVRGPWPDDSWKGWWGDNPPYHAPTFVLTHYEREPLVMEGGTTFHFVTGGIQEALRLAKQAAGDKDVKIGGGVATVRQYLQAGLVDSMHFALAPVVLGKGEQLFAGLDLPALGFSVTQREATEHAMHVVLERK